MHTNSDSYPTFLAARFSDTKTFLKVIKKGCHSVKVYFDASTIYLVTVDVFDRQVDYEERTRSLTLN
jgi:hypothetical protein